MKEENKIQTEQTGNQSDDFYRFDAVVGLPLNTFINDDCMNWLPKCPPKFFELAIVDPQYGIGASKPSKKPERVLQKNGKLLYVESNKHPGTFLAINNK